MLSLRAALYGKGIYNEDNIVVPLESMSVHLQ